MTELSRPSKPLIVPLLFPDAHAHVVSDAADRFQPLVSKSLERMWADEPIVCFVEEGDGDDRALSLSEHPDLRKRAEQTMHYQAEVPFTIDLGKKVTAGVYGATAFSAANIVSAAQMRRIGALLGSDDLWVAVPRGNTMYAVSTDTGWEGHQRLLQLVDRVYRNSGAVPELAESMLVSYSIWRMSDGHITSRDMVGPDKPEMDVVRPPLRRIGACLDGQEAAGVVGASNYAFALDLCQLSVCVPVCRPAAGGLASDVQPGTSLRCHRHPRWGIVGGQFAHEMDQPVEAYRTSQRLLGEERR